MPKVTEAHLEARKQQIVDAAGACFSRKGFHQTTMQDICTEAGLSPGAVYRYFAAKEDIIASMVEERRRHGMALIETIQREREDTLGVLDEIAEVFFHKLDDVQGCAVDVELWAEAQANPRIREAVNADVCEITDAFERIIRQAQEKGEINGHLDARSVAYVLNSMFFGLVQQKTIEPSIQVGPYVAVIKALTSGHFWRDTGTRRVSDV